MVKRVHISIGSILLRSTKKLRQLHEAATLLLLAALNFALPRSDGVQMEDLCMTKR